MRNTAPASNPTGHQLAPARRCQFPALLLAATLALGTALEAQSYDFTTIAGVAAKPGGTDGTGGGANLPLFNQPISVRVGGNGQIYIADSVNHLIRQVSTTGLVSTVAGTPGTSGNGNGTGVDNGASFSLPQGLAFDSAGNLYVADFAAATVRKITPAGVVTTQAGIFGATGTLDGTTTTATFLNPSGVVADNAGNLYVSDAGAHTIRKIATDGKVTTFAGTAGASGAIDGTGAAARFNKPRGMVIDPAGNLYVADYNNNTIRKITPAGVVTTYAGAAGLFGSADGAATTAKFNFPTDVAIDSSGNLYVADSANNAIRKISPAGQVSTLAGTAGAAAGLVDGTGAAARFNTPTGVTLDSSGNVYVADYNNQVIRKITATGIVSTLAGTGKTTGVLDGQGYILSPSLFNNPTGLSINTAGTIFVADTDNNLIRKIAADGTVTTFAGSSTAQGRADGTGTAASFTDPTATALDSNGNVYVADTTNHTIRKITPAGVVTTFAGTVGTPGSNDASVGTSAAFNFPTGLAVDAAGNLYVADYGNSTIRKITPAGVVSTFAGAAGSAGSTNAVGSAARFKFPRSVAIDTSGNLYVADSGNHMIRKISSSGVVQTLAGTAGASGTADGTGAAARFSGPSGIAVDTSGNVYVSDSDNNTIRKITAAGAVTTIGGTAGSVGNRDGAGAAARFDHPNGLTVDAAGILYIADSRNHTIRKGVPAGSASTGTGVSSGNTSSPTTGSSTNGASGSSTTSGTTGGGSGTGGSGGTGGTGTGAGFLLQPGGIAVTNTGYYVSDTANNSIKKIATDGTVTVFAGKDGSAGTTDAKSGDARFNSPTGIALDTSGNVYVCDTGNATIRKINTSGDVSTLAGSPGSRGTQDGTGSAASFSNPTSIIFYGGNLYVTDSANATIRMITPAGVVTTYAGKARTVGETDGPAATALFNNPAGLAFDGAGNIYVADTFNNTIRKITTAKRSVTATAAGTILTDGSATVVVTDAGLTGSPITLSVPVTAGDAPSAWAGKVVTALTANTAISARYTAASNGASITLAYVSTVDDTAVANLSLNNGTCTGITPAPTSRASDAAGTVSTLAGSAGISGAYDGTGIFGLFNRPAGMSADVASGNIYVADSGNSIIRQITSRGVVTTIAGLAGISGNRDGAYSSALFNQPQALALASNSLIVVDTGNSVLRSVAYATSTVSTVALKNPTTTTSTTTTSTSTGTTTSGGGGGAPSLWFYGLLSVLAVIRRHSLFRRA